MPAERPSRGQGSYKKLINDPFEAVDEALEGFVAAHADVVRLAAPRVVARRSAAVTGTPSPGPREPRFRWVPRRSTRLASVRPAPAL